MTEMNERDGMLVHYLTEAHGKEEELVQSLEAHIGMTSKAAYKKRLRAHLTETRQHARLLERRVKQLGGGDQIGGAMHAIQSVAERAVAVAKAPMHAIRGGSDEETMLKNAKTEYFNEAEEIANYNAIESLAERLGDTETAKLARAIRRDEERMAKFLEGQISTLAKAVAMEVPAAQRRGNGGVSRRKASSASSRKNGAGASGRSRAAAKRPARTRGAQAASGRGRSPASKAATKRTTTSRSAAAR